MNLDSQDIAPGLFEQLIEALRGEREAVRAFDEAAAEVLGINLTDLRCLGILERHDRMPATELARESRLTSGSMTVLIDRLERAGYVRRVRDQNDRRRVFVELTARARESIRRIWGPVGQEGAQITSGYSKAQVRAITDYLLASRDLLTRHHERLKALAEGPGALAD